MTLRELAVRNVRGLREFRLRLDDKSIVLVGPNGCGKSSVVDALDLLLTGHVHRLEGEGAGGLSIASHGKHVDAELDDAWVEATFMVERSGQQQKLPVRVRRTLKPPQLDPAELPPSLAPLFSQAERLRHHLLSRREILKFIIARPGDRGDQVAALLDVEGVDEQRKEIAGAAKDAASRVKEADEKIRRLTAEMLGTFDPVATVDDVLGRVNAHRATLGAPALATLDGTSVTDGVQTGTATGTEHPLWASESGLRRLSTGETFAALTSDVDAYLERARAVGGAGGERAHDERNLIDAGLRLLEESHCPLCESPISGAELRVRLAARRAAVERAAQEVQDLRDARALLAALHESILRDVRDVATRLADLPEAKELVDLARRFNLPALPEPAADGETSATPVTAEMARTLQRCATALLSATQSAPKPSGSAKAWTELQGVAKKLNALALERSARHNAAAQSKFFGAAEKAFVAARADILDGIYASIASRVELLYARVHGSAVRQTTLTSTKTGLELEVDFHGRGRFPPSALHSEGQQDTLGICLFLALAERASGGPPPLLILDDVLMSVDAEHRRAVADLLQHEFRSTQFVITTHDEVWSRQLKNLGVVAKEYRFADWSIDEGPSTPEAHDAFAQMRSDLEAGRVPTAAHLLRRTVETILPDICEALGARVRYRKDQRHDLGDFFAAAKGKLGDLLRAGVAASKSWKQDSSALEKRLADYAAARDALGKEEWSVNPAVHYNAWAQMNAQDFKPVVDAYENFLPFFSCHSCHGLLHVEGSGDGASVRCPCGAVGWNLRRPR